VWRPQNAGRRHHRPRAWATRTWRHTLTSSRRLKEEARQAAHRSRFLIQGHSGPPPSAGRLLCRRFGREAQFRIPTDRRHAWLEEGLPTSRRRSPRRADVRAVPDPRYPIILRGGGGVFDRGGASASAAVGPRRRIFSATARGAAITHSIPKTIAVVVCYPSKKTPSRRSRFYRS